MKGAVTQEERYEQMMREPVETLIPKMAIPTIISMLVTSIYNMADTFFVSKLGTSAAGAVGIIFSLMAIIQALAFMIGMGTGNNIARLLGQQKREAAQRYAAVGWITEFVVGVILAAICLSCLDSLVIVLGATDTIAPYAVDYAKYILYAAPFMMCSFGMNNMLRFQGNAFYAMVGITTGGILNMILDPILIFGFDMGISGAAIATGFSQVVSFVILLCQCNFNRSCIPIRISDIRPELRMYRNILISGIPSLTRQGISSISVIILNHAAQPYGDAAIAAVSIVNRFMNFLNSAVIGFGQGFQPVAGFNFGAGNYDRVKRAFGFCIKVSTVVLFIFAAVSFIFAEPIIAMFRKEDLEVVAIGTLTLRLQALTLPLLGFITMSNMFTQTIGYGFRSSIISLLRQGICLIPVLMIFPKFFGLLGIEMSQTVADIMSVIIAGIIVKGILVELTEKAEEGHEKQSERL